RPLVGAHLLLLHAAYPGRDHRADLRLAAACPGIARRQTAAHARSYHRPCGGERAFPALFRNAVAAISDRRLRPTLHSVRRRARDLPAGDRDMTMAARPSADWIAVPDPRAQAAGRNDVIDTMRGIAILTVIGIHSLQQPLDTPWAIAIDAALRPCVPIFLFASGYLTALSGRVPLAG